MKVIYNKFIPFKGYKAMNLFGIVFVRKGAKFDTYDYNHEHIHLKQMQEMLWIFYYLWYAIEYLIIMFFQVLQTTGVIHVIVHQFQLRSMRFFHLFDKIKDIFTTTIGKIHSHNLKHSPRS